VNFIKKNYFLYFIILSAFVFFIPDTHDGTILDYGFETKDFSGISTMFTEITRYFDYVLLKIIFKVCIFFDLPYQFIFDLITVIILILFSFEVKKYSEIVFKLDSFWSNFSGILAITFPVWHVLVSSPISLTLISFYLALLGYRIFISRKIELKLLGMVLIICSFNVLSNLSFIIGLSLAHNIMLYSRKEELQVRILFSIICLSLIFFFFKSTFFPPHGYYENYNQPNFAYLKPSFVLQNLYNFLTFFLFYLWIPIAHILFTNFFKINNSIKKIFKKDLYLSLLAISLIFICAIAPYLLVNKSTDLFFFSEHESRHAILVSVSFSLFFTILLKKINDTNDYKKLNNFFLILVVLQSICILNLSIYTKIEDSIFRHNFVEQIKKISNFPSGKVEILSSQLSFTHMRPYEVEYFLFKAFKKRAWEVKFVNEIDRLERFKNLYIFNFKDYFKIKLLSTSC